MDYSMESRVRRPCALNHPTNCQFPHHHHHFRASPQCPLHSYMLYSNNHSPNCSLLTSHPQNVSSHPLPNIHNLSTSHPQNVSSHPLPNLQSLPFPQTAAEVRLMNEEWEEEEEEEDPVFVLTDEWREFFAKSEAKRRQAKKQAKMKTNG